MKKNIIPIILAIFLATSCEKENSTKNEFKETINLKIYEPFDSIDYKPKLSFYTTKQFSCLNYRIKFASTITNDKITIKFLGIDTLGICLTATGPASNVLDLKDLQLKTYELELDFGTEKVNGQLINTQESYNLIIPTQSKVIAVRPKLMKLPNDCVFGTIHYHNSATTPLVNTYIDSLKDKGATNEVYSLGEYDHFEIEPSGIIKQKQDQGYDFTKYYIFKKSGNLYDLKNLVRYYGTNYPDSLSITLRNNKRQTIYSWVP